MYVKGYTHSRSSGICGVVIDNYYCVKLSGIISAVRQTSSYISLKVYANLQDNTKPAMESVECDVPEDEEEILVYVEFEGFVSSETFNNEQLQLDMIGIDTDHPIMQINGKFYEGTYEDAVGTYLFFEEDDDPPPGDPVFDTIPTLKYFAKTRKLLKMQRVFVKERTEVLGESDHPECIPNMETIRKAGVPPKYQEEALEFWKKIRDKRMEDLSSYLQKQKIREEKKSQGIVPDSESDEDNPFAAYKHEQEISRMMSSTSLSKESDQVLLASSKTNDASELVEKDTSNTKTNTDTSLLNISEKTSIIDPKPSTSKEGQHELKENKKSSIPDHTSMDIDSDKSSVD